MLRASFVHSFFTILTFAAVFWYACEAKKQREATEQTNAMTKEISSARIVVKSHIIEFSYWDKNPKLTHSIAKITIKNAGGTVANDLFVDGGGCGAGIDAPHGVIEIHANPRPGEGLAPQDTKEYSFDCGASNWDYMADTPEFHWSYILISYRDIYGRVYAVPDCVFREPQLKYGPGVHPCNSLSTISSIFTAQ